MSSSFTASERVACTAAENKRRSHLFLFRYSALRKSEAKSGQWVVIGRASPSKTFDLANLSLAGAGGGLVSRISANRAPHIANQRRYRDILHAKLVAVEWHLESLELTMEARKIW